MTKRMIAPIIFGLAGAAILIWLGLWQVQRMSWKHDMLARIDAQILATPMTLDTALALADHEFQPVAFTGRSTGDELHVLTSIKQIGAVYRIITPFVTDTGQRILLDLGYIPVTDKDTVRPAISGDVTGNLRTPEESDKYTPAPDIGANIWFARDAALMAKSLNTEPVFVVLRTGPEIDPPVTPFPIDTQGIPDDHLSYAVTWFSLAFIWLGMTCFLLWRIKFRTV